MPARPQAQTQGGRISPSVTITYSDLVQKSLRKAPGPGAYESTHSLGDDMHPATKFSTLALQSSFVTKAGKITPAPGQYDSTASITSRSDFRDVDVAPFCTTVRRDRGDQQKPSHVLLKQYGV